MNSTERAAKTRAKKASEGLIRVEVWARPEDKAAIKAIAAKLLKGETDEPR